MRFLQALSIVVMLSACAPQSKDGFQIYGKWVDVENYTHEFKADSSMTLGSCKATGSFTLPVDGKMDLFVSQSQFCLEQGLHECEVEVLSQDEIHVSCGLLNTRLTRQTN